MIYGISYKTLIGPIPLHIRFDKIYGFIEIYDGTKFLTLFGSVNYYAIYDRIRYLISLKSDITYIFLHYSAKIIVYTYHSLPIEKTLTLHNVTILIKSVINKDKNCYYWKIFLEKIFQLAFQLAKK